MNAFTIPDDLSIPTFLDRRNPAAAGPIWTFTGLNTYDDICAYQFFRKFIKKDIKYFETPAQKAGNDAHRALELRIGRGVPLPVGMAHLEPLIAPLDGKGAQTELKLGITIDGRSTGHFDKDVWCRGRLDVAIVSSPRDPATAGGQATSTAYIIDHKNGKVREDPFELEIQGLLLKAKYPHIASIKAKYLWIQERRYGALHDVSDTARTWARVRGIAARIASDQVWAKQPNGLCRAHCDVFDCSHNGRRK